MTTRVIGKLSYNPSDPSKIIGRGSFGIVFNASYHYFYYFGAISRLGKLVAVKRVLKSRLHQNSNEAIVKQKLGHLRKTSHPNILRYICAEFDYNFM